MGPAALLQRNHFGEIIGHDTVRALGADPSGDPSDIVLSVDHTIAEADAGPRQDRTIHIRLGHVHLATLLDDLQNVFATMGDVHWGDATDARLLCDALDVGFFMFADRLQAAGTRCLCALDLLRGDFPFFINLLWDEPVHFRAAEFRGAETEAFQMCYAQTEVPEFLRAQYNVANVRAPVGRQIVPM